MMSVRLSLSDVRNVDFDDGDADGADAIGEGDRGVGIGSGIHHHGVKLAVSGLQLVNQNTFVVRLEIGNLVLRETLAELRQIGLEGEVSVDFRLAFAQKVQVGSVEDENFHLGIFCKNSLFLRLKAFFGLKS